MNKETLLGFNICNTTYSELINCIFSDFDNNITNFIININPEIITVTNLFRDQLDRYGEVYKF